MSQIPSELKYTRTHEWVKKEEDGTFLVGVTDHAQHLLGDIVYIELPELSRQVEVGSEICVIESVKAAADVYSPLAGEVIAVNELLNTEPNLVNTSPYDGGWLFKLKTDTDIQDLLDAKGYEEQINK